MPPPRLTVILANRPMSRLTLAVRPSTIIRFLAPARRFVYRPVRQIIASIPMVLMFLSPMGPRPPPKH